MRPIGFSTGALARGDFSLALQLLKTTDTDAVELSALRVDELARLAETVDSLDLSQFKYISVHAPSKFAARDEPAIIRCLEFCLRRNWPIIVHPDAINSSCRWREFGDLLLIENMDKRKPVGRSARELEPILDTLPEARLCFDIAHARQFDSSMTEAYFILKQFSHLIRQIHISEVDTRSRHVRITPSAARDYQEIAYLIPVDVPIILESSIRDCEIAAEMRNAVASITTTVGTEHGQGIPGRYGFALARLGSSPTSTHLD